MINLLNCCLQLEVGYIFLELTHFNGLVIFHIKNEIDQLPLSIDNSLGELCGSRNALHHYRKLFKHHEDRVGWDLHGVTNS